MKLAITLLSFGLSLTAMCHAQNYVLSSSPEDALKACEEKAAASPQALREKTLNFCNCVVKNTDFDKAAELNKLGDTETLKTLYDTAEEACGAYEVK